MPTLSLAELGQFLTEHYRHDILRVELRQGYYNDSEQDGLHRYLHGEPATSNAGDTPWTRQLRAHVAAGRSWRVLHAVTRPLSDYLRYECEWGYVHNAAAGQQIRLLDVTDHAPALRDDLLIIDEDVFVYRYDDDGRFVDAIHITDAANTAHYRDLAEELWDRGEDFTRWWSRHPSYHREAAA